MNIPELRERREEFIKRSIRENKNAMVCIKPNFPGAEKRNIYSNYASYKIYKELIKTVNIIEISHEFEAEGLIFYLRVDELAKDLKPKTIEIEIKHDLGRLIDIDVYDINANQISREEYGLPRRKCFICDKDAVICSRAMTHTKDEIVEFYKKTVKDFVLKSDSEILRIAEFCLLNELMRDISLGTVTPNTNGCHNDMDMYTFFDSMDAISKGLNSLNKAHAASFQTLRSFGLDLEKKMYGATMGINTHKGIIFAFLLILGGLMHSDCFGELSSKISKLAAGSLDDFKNVDSNGLKIYNLHGIKGARGEAVSGYKNAFANYIEYFRNSEDLDMTFLKIASDTEDTNIIHRAGMDVYLEYKHKLKNTLNNPDGLNELEGFCLNFDISAGGSADMISITLLLFIIEDHFESVKRLFENDLI